MTRKSFGNFVSNLIRPLTTNMSQKSSKEKKRARGSSSTDGGEDVDLKILEKLSGIQDRIERGFTKMDADFAALKSELQHEIRVVKKELREVSTSLEAAWVEVEMLKEKNTLLDGQLQQTLQKNSNLSEEVRVLKERAIRLEDYSRRENLRFLMFSRIQRKRIKSALLK